MGMQQHSSSTEELNQSSASPIEGKDGVATTPAVTTTKTEKLETAEPVASNDAAADDTPEERTASPETKMTNSSSAVPIKCDNDAVDDRALLLSNGSEGVTRIVNPAVIVASRKEGARSPGL